MKAWLLEHCTALMHLLRRHRQGLVYPGCLEAPCTRGVLQCWFHIRGTTLGSPLALIHLAQVYCSSALTPCMLTASVDRVWCTQGAWKLQAPWGCNSRSFHNKGLGKEGCISHRTHRSKWHTNRLAS